MAKNLTLTWNTSKKMSLKSMIKSWGLKDLSVIIATNLFIMQIKKNLILCVKLVIKSILQVYLSLALKRKSQNSLMAYLKTILTLKLVLSNLPFNQPFHKLLKVSQIQSVICAICQIQANWSNVQNAKIINISAASIAKITIQTKHLSIHGNVTTASFVLYANDLTTSLLSLFVTLVNEPSTALALILLSAISLKKLTFVKIAKVKTPARFAVRQTMS